MKENSDKLVEELNKAKERYQKLEAALRMLDQNYQETRKQNAQQILSTQDLKLKILAENEQLKLELKEKNENEDKIQQKLQFVKVKSKQEQTTLKQ